MKSKIPAVIIVYNQLTYLKNMVQQLEPFVEKIIVVDNKSTYQPLLDYYDKEFKHTLIRRDVNAGPRSVYTCPIIQEMVGDVYIVTDPDILFNPKLPSNFIEDFLEISHQFKAHRVGFALNVTDDDIRTDLIYQRTYTVPLWEQKFWRRWKKRIYKNHELYLCGVDTTFCLNNRVYRGEKELAIRVAGDCTAIHMPWHRRFMDYVPQDEADAYMIGNNSISWVKK
jgi:glycosyltransferase involved in cell wall biosynthesis